MAEPWNQPQGGNKNSSPQKPAPTAPSARALNNIQASLSKPQASDDPSPPPAGGNGPGGLQAVSDFSTKRRCNYGSFLSVSTLPSSCSHISALIYNHHATIAVLNKLVHLPLLVLFFSDLAFLASLSLFNLSVLVVTPVRHFLALNSASYFQLQVHLFSILPSSLVERAKVITFCALSATQQ